VLPDTKGLWLMKNRDAKLGFKIVLHPKVMIAYKKIDWNPSIA